METKCVYAMVRNMLGFPIIASTSGLLRKSIKLLVFVGCLGGFLYQTSEFLTYYRAYPTMVDIMVAKPDTVDTPAVSFCNANRIRRKVVCVNEPDMCAWFTSKAEFCTTYPKYCIPWEPDNKLVMGIGLFKTVNDKNRSREYVAKLGESLKDFMKGCVVKTKAISPCRNILTIPWVDQKGMPHNCFTAESLWGSPEAEPRKMPLSGIISLRLKPQPEEYMLYYSLVMVHILMHEAHSLGNPFMEGIAMEVGKTYNVFVNQRVTERLPAPYTTNCTDYLKLWKQNGGYGPLSGKACAEECKMKQMLETEGCVAQTVSYPGNYPICDNETILPSDDLIKKCSFQCKEACREVSYSIHHEVAYDQTAQCGGDENCKFKEINLMFIFNRLEVETFFHQPRYESVEMFSYIGGYMGMWLGISLVALFDFAETMVSLVTYRCRRKRKKATVIVHSYY